MSDSSDSRELEANPFRLLRQFARARGKRRLPENGGPGKAGPGRNRVPAKKSPQGRRKKKGAAGGGCPFAWTCFALTGPLGPGLPTGTGLPSGARLVTQWCHRLLAGADGASQTGVILAVFHVPERLAQFDSATQHFDLLF